MNDRYGNGSDVKPVTESRYTPHTNRKGSAFNSEALARKIMMRYGPFMTINSNREEQHWKWNGNIWKQIDFDRYSRPIVDLLPAGSKTARAVKNVIDMMSCLTHAKEPEENQWQRAVRFAGKNSVNISVQDEVLNINLSTGRISQRDPDSKELVTSALPIAYDPQAKCPTFDYVLKSCLPDEEDRRLLQCFVGYCLIPDHRFECVLFCFGIANSGKSLLILHGVGCIFGEELTSHVSMEKICKGGDEIRSLVDSLVNISTELNPRNYEDSSVFNQIALAEPMDVALKWRVTQKYIPFAKHFFLANHIMSFNRGSTAEERRVQVLNFPNDFTKKAKDGKLKKEIEQEGSGIFNWALQGLLEVSKLQQLPMGSEESQMHARKFSMNNDPMGNFTRVFCHRAKGVQMPIKDFDSLYRYWCEEQNVTIKQQPSKTLRDLNPHIRRRKTTVDGQSVRLFTGIELNQKGKELMLEMKGNGPFGN